MLRDTICSVFNSFVSTEGTKHTPLLSYHEKQEFIEEWLQRTQSPGPAADELDKL